MQTPQDPLAELRDIHLPPPVSAWPPAVGWWVLLALALLLPALLWWRIRARRKSVRRFALKDLAAMEQTFASNPDPIAFAIQLSSLIRRVALVRYPRAEVAGLHGEEWTNFLISHSSPEFANEFILLEKVPYAPPSEIAQQIDVDRLISATRLWIRRNAA